MGDCLSCDAWAEWFYADGTGHCLAHGPAEAQERARLVASEYRRIKGEDTDVWTRRMWLLLNAYLRDHGELFVDELWADPSFDRSQGAEGVSRLLKRAFERGLIEHSGQRKPAVIFGNAERPIWRSLIHQGVLM